MPDSVAPPAPGAPAPVVAPVAGPVGLQRLRVFSDDANRLATDWVSHPEPVLAWVPDTAAVEQPGAEGGFWVTAAPYRGYAKPLAQHRTDPHAFPVAAIEKIASDLAHELRLPVPPVALWQRTNAPANQPVHHAVSAPPFKQVQRWGDVTQVPAVYAAIKPLAVPTMSAMVVFDTWLQCEDHAGNHPGNLLVTSDAGPPLTAHFAFIDYSFSMINKWRAGHAAMYIAPMYDPSLAADIDVLRETIDAIAGVSDHAIEVIVGRIPDPFIAAADKTRIIDGLKYRRDRLREILASQYPGVK